MDMEDLTRHKPFDLLSLFPVHINCFHNAISLFLYLYKLTFNIQFVCAMFILKIMKFYYIINGSIETLIFKVLLWKVKLKPM